MKRAKKITSCLLAAFVLCMGVFSSMYSPRATAFAAESASEQFEAQNVTTDLKNSVIAGEKFNAADYPHIDLMMSHINSYGRKRLNDRSPYEVFSLMYEEGTAELLGIRKIPNDEIILTPKLLKK